MPFWEEKVLKSEYIDGKEADFLLSALMPANATVMRTALHTGLRIGDVLALKTEQLAPRFWITEAKTGKRRQVGLPKQLLAEIKAGAGEIWAFPGRDPTKHRTRQAVWHDVKRAAKLFRFKMNATPHSFRKLYAVRMLERTGDLEAVQKSLNHTFPSTTMIYAMANVFGRKKRKKKRKP